MRILSLVVSASMALGLASCGGTSETVGQNANPSLGSASSNVPKDPDATPSVASSAGSPHASPSISGPEGRKPNTPAPANRAEGDVPPKDAQFTIFCDVYRGADHVLRASEAKKELTSASGKSAWHIIHTEDQSSLFFGFYKSFDDKVKFPQEAARAQYDMKFVSELKDSNGERRFKSTLFVPIDEADPEAPYRWNLVNAPEDAYWSLQIAAYRGSADRKLMAVEGVRELRKMGYDAYYYHGDTISSVCIGAWPKSAVKEQDGDHVQTHSDNDIPLVVGDSLPGNVIPDMRDKQGHHLTVVAPKLEVLSKTMAKAIKDFPNHAINGVWYAKVGKNGQQFIDPSFLVVLPHREQQQSPTNEAPPPQEVISRDAAGETAAGNILENTTTPGYTRLRSIGQ